MRPMLPVALALFALAVPSAALAGANKTWVSGTGKDTGTCPITAPCASFQYAVNQTAAGGEVDVKDAGGYGTVVINKAISIVAANGVLATISVPKYGTGIIVNSPYIDGVVISGITVDCHELLGNGVNISTETYISKSAFRNCFIGINVISSKISVDNTDLTGNAYGIASQDSSSSPISVYLSSDRFAMNVFGIGVGQNGQFYTHGNNSFSDNQTDSNPSGGLTAIGLK